MNRVVFHRNLTARIDQIGKVADGEVLTPGEYVKVPSGAPISAIAWAFLCCPGCHAIWTLGKRNHTVDGTGVVSPSDVCPNPSGCSFHEFIRLDAWSDA
jgi:hypothetical protein